MSERAGEGWNGYVHGVGPLQGAGRVDGYPWYFRARHSHWSMEIAEDSSMNEDALPLVGTEVSGWLIEVFYGPSPAASYMEERIGWEFIERTIEQFRRRALPYVKR
jgi:hypothetical protein